MPQVTVDVPIWYVKNKPVNFALETAQSLGASLTLRGRFGRRACLPPPSAGVFSLWELHGCKFVSDPACSLLEYAKAVWLAVERERAVGLDPEEVNLRSKCFACRFGKELIRREPEVREWLLEVPFTGFEMLRNKSDRAAEPYLFGAPFLAAQVKRLGECGATPFDALWRVPLCMAGHVAEITDAGKLEPMRPKDRADYELKCAEALDREVNGFRHPWQSRYPKEYPLSPVQRAIRHEKAKKLSAARKEAKENMA